MTGPDSEGQDVDPEGFTAAERAESLATAEAVFGTLPTSEQVARSKAGYRGAACWPPVVPSVGAVPVEVPEVEFDFTLTSTIAEAVLNGPGEWIGIGAELALLASVVREKVKPLIAARVRAAFHVPEIARASSGWGVFCAACSAEVGDYVYPCRLLDTDGWWSEFPKRIGPAEADPEHDARVRAEERQRIDGLIAARLAAPVGTTEYGNDALVALRAEIAAGSAIPVATPEATVEIGGQKMTQAQFDAARFPLLNPPPCSSCRRPKSGEEPPGSDLCWPCLRVERHHGYVARVEPVDEVKCPGCEATIRAQMSDQPAPERGAALEDLEHALTLALQAMAENDCCADEDDPDWRGPAIEQFRQDLRALGVRDAEMDAVGIKAPAEQDGQR